jgi:hypothetical protein
MLFFRLVVGLGGSQNVIPLHICAARALQSANHLPRARPVSGLPTWQLIAVPFRSPPLASCHPATALGPRMLRIGYRYTVRNCYVQVSNA